MSTHRTIAFVLAGGEGARLRPLTDELPKPALPFAGHCRIIDFALANLQHSGIDDVYVLLQYRPLALLRHLARHWPQVRPVLPVHAYAGTADAVAQALQQVPIGTADLVAVLAADHVYRMDLRPMADFHLRQRAGVTVAAAAVAAADASQFGVLEVDDDGRITRFQEKPRQAPTLPGDPTRAFVSMGNYLFAPDLLAQTLAPGRLAPRDFGHDVIPGLVRQGRAHAYDFRRQAVPGLQSHEEPAYWRDVGTLQAYAQAQADTQGSAPRFALDNPHWAIPRTLPSTDAVTAARSTLPAAKPGPMPAMTHGAAMRAPLHVLVPEGWRGRGAVGSLGQPGAAGVAPVHTAPQGQPCGPAQGPARRAQSR